MNNSLTLLLIASLLTFGSLKYNGSTTATVVLSGGIIKAQSVVVDKKYKRKDCPVCKGKGYYISGDGISKVDCGYCEPDKKDGAPAYEDAVTHPPVVIKQNCPDGSCKSKK